MTAYFGMLAKNLEMDFSPDSVFSAKDPAYRFFVDRMVPAFDHKGSASIVAIDGSITRPDVQQALIDLHHTMETVQGIDDVQSLVNASVYVDQGGMMQLLPIFKGNHAQLELVRAFLDNPTHPPYFISQDQQTVAVAIRSPMNYKKQAANEALAKQFKVKLAEVQKRHPSLTFYLTGNPSIQEEAIGTLQRDQIRFVPIVVLLMVVVLWFSFRHLRGVLLPFLTTAVATIWAIGWLVLRGHPLDIVNSSIIVLLLVIGISVALHIIARFEDELQSTRQQSKSSFLPVDKNIVIAQTVQNMALPCFLTTATTALGFASSITAKVEIVKQFGIDAAMGVMGTYVAALLLIPSLLSLMPLPAEKTAPTFLGVGLSIDSILKHITRFSLRFPKSILLSSLFLGGIAFLEARHIQSNQTLVSELPQSAPPVVALHFVQNHLGGILPFDIVFEGPKSLLKEPKFIQQAARIQEEVRQVYLQPQTHSFADVLRSIGYSLHEEKTPKPVSQWSEEKTAQLLLLLELSGEEGLKQVSEGFYAPHGDLFRIQATIHNASTRDITKMKNQILTILNQNPIQGASIHLTGGAIIASEALDNTLYNVASSLGLAVVMIWLLVLLLFRSFRLSLIILLPNLLPILFTLAMMQITGVSLRVATIMIFSMVLGITVDTCIHLIARLREEVKRHHLSNTTLHKSQVYHILERTIRGSGRPIVYSTFLLLIGFSVLGFSAFEALRDFSILSAITLAAALAVNFLLLPALVLLMNPLAQQKTIRPLFETRS